MAMNNNFQNFDNNLSAFLASTSNVNLTVPAGSGTRSSIPTVTIPTTNSISAPNFDVIYGLASRTHPISVSNLLAATTSSAGSSATTNGTIFTAGTASNNVAGNMNSVLALLQQQQLLHQQEQQHSLSMMLIKEQRQRIHQQLMSATSAAKTTDNRNDDSTTINDHEEEMKRKEKIASLLQQQIQQQSQLQQTSVCSSQPFKKRKFIEIRQDKGKVVVDDQNACKKQKLSTSDIKNMEESLVPHKKQHDTKKHLKEKTYINKPNKYSKNFPMVLYKVLMENKYEDILSWSSDGKSCVIYDVERFEKHVVGNYFTHCNIESFQRQLRRYHFQSKKHQDFVCIGATSSSDQSISSHATGQQKPTGKVRTSMFIMHEKFVRKREDLCIELCKEKGLSKTGVPSQPILPSVVSTKLIECDENLQAARRRGHVASRLHNLRHMFIQKEDGAGSGFGDTMKAQKTAFVTSSQKIKAAPKESTSATNTKSSLDTLASIALESKCLQQRRDQAEKEPPSFNDTKGIPTTQLLVKHVTASPEEANCATAITNTAKTKTATDTSMSKNSKQEQVQEDREILPSSWMKYNKHFPIVLYNLLMDSPKNGIDNVINWSDDGKSFTVYDTKKFENEIMGSYFMHCNFQSFQRQLRRYNFTTHRGHATSSTSVEKSSKTPIVTIRHDLFVRGDKKSCFTLCQSKKNRASRAMSHKNKV